MMNENSKGRQEPVNRDRPEGVCAPGSRLGGNPSEGWESLLAVDEDAGLPIDHCAVLSEN